MKTSAVNESVWAFAAACEFAPMLMFLSLAFFGAGFFVPVVSSATDDVSTRLKLDL